MTCAEAVARCFDAAARFLRSAAGLGGAASGSGSGAGEKDDLLPDGAAGSSYGNEEKVLKGFIIARHSTLGYLVLKAFKNRKGIHGQLPGGNLDSDDSSPAAGAARELFEETGIDLRKNLGRLKLAVFPDGSTLLKGRQFFRLDLTDADATGHSAPDNNVQFRLKLSSEHVGYVFEKDAKQVADLVELHSGGKCARAVRALECGMTEA